MLNRNKFLLIEKKFGLHQFDLMSLDSNVMQEKDGLPLCHFTPFSTPGSAGVNVFSQTLCPSDNLYVFPPFALVLPVLNYLRSQKVKFCTMVVMMLNRFGGQCFVIHWWIILLLARKGN